VIDALPVESNDDCVQTAIVTDTLANAASASGANQGFGVLA